MKNFKNKCTKCGLCCQHAGMVKDFPEDVDENGCCVHLKDKKCSIYKNRPLICRVDDYYETVKDKYKSKQEFIDINIRVCNSMIKHYGVGDEYLIKEKKHDSN